MDSQSDLQRMRIITGKIREMLMKSADALSIDQLVAELRMEPVPASPFDVRMAIWRLIDNQEASFADDVLVKPNRENIQRRQEARSAS